MLHLYNKHEDIPRGLCIFVKFCKPLRMDCLRKFKVLLLFAAAALVGCMGNLVPEDLRIPELPAVSAVAEGRVVTLSATFKDEKDFASAKEFGFYFGEDEQSMERMTVAKTDGLGYSLIMGNLEYSTTYLYKAWVGNGRDEEVSDLRAVATGEEPVGPDPPSPVEQNIEFKDQVVKALCVENWDLDGDGELSKDEAAKVTNLRWVFKRNNEITSFEELEYFTGLRSVADSAFKCCANLRSVKLPESVWQIGDYAFDGCQKVLISKLPDNLEIIGTHAFRFCSMLSWMSLPESLRSIAGFAFDHCKSLNLTKLPSGLTRIEDGVFANCPSISPESLPSGLTFLGRWAFFECFSFNPKLLQLPAGLEYIAESAFNGCGFSEISIPEKVEYIGPHAFERCNLLRKVTVQPITPPEMEDTFLGDNADEIFVPSASLEKYKTAKNWSEWETKYKPLTENSGQAL